MDERFLPEKVICPSIPDDWTPEEAVISIKKLTTVVKPKVEDIIHEFWIAHEMIVGKKAGRKLKDWTWIRFCDEAGYAPKTPRNWFQKYNLPYTNKAEAKPLLRENYPNKPAETKPETKAKIIELVDAIKHETIHDQDLKAVVDTIADKLLKGEIETLVGTKMATAVKKSFKKGVIPEPKPIDNFERLSKHALAFVEGLQFWADGTMKPETPDEAIAAKIVLDNGPSLIVHYSRLGLNVMKVWETFIDPDRREKNEETKSIKT